MTEKQIIEITLILGSMKNYTDENGILTPRGLRTIIRICKDELD